MQRQAERRGDHGQQKRDGERGRYDEQHQLMPFILRPRGLAFLFFAAPVGERRRARLSAVPSPLDRGHQLRWRHRRGTKGNVGAFKGEVDVCLCNAGNLLQSRLDSCCTGGAGHAADVEHHMGRRRLNFVLRGLDIDRKRHQHSSMFRLTWRPASN